VVNDSVGQATFMKIVDCCPAPPDGELGQSSGVSAPLSAINITCTKGSLYLTRPTLATFAARREDLERRRAAVRRTDQRRGAL